MFYPREGKPIHDRIAIPAICRECLQILATTNDAKKFRSAPRHGNRVDDPAEISRKAGFAPRLEEGRCRVWRNVKGRRRPEPPLRPHLPLGSSRLRQVLVAPRHLRASYPEPPRRSWFWAWAKIARARAPQNREPRAEKLQIWHFWAAPQHSMGAYYHKLGAIRLAGVTFFFFRPAGGDILAALYSSAPAHRRNRVAKVGA